MFRTRALCGLGGAFRARHAFQRSSVRWFSKYPDHTPILMPALSPTMEKGNLGAWHVKVGDEINTGDSYCDIETDKATQAFESTDDGFIAAILKPANSQDVPIGAQIAVQVEDKGDVAAFADYTGEEAASSTPDTSTAAPQAASLSAAAAPAADWGEHQRIEMPALSPTMEVGNLGAWHKSIGDRIEVGDSYCDIETDKATQTFDATDEGYLAKILVPANTKDVPIGKLLAVVVEEEGEVSKFKEYSDDAVSAVPAAATSSAAPAAASPAPAAAPGALLSSGGRVVASPLAKTAARVANVDLSQLAAGSGPGGRIIASDVAKFATSPQQAAPAAQQVTTPVAAQAAVSAPPPVAPAGGFEDVPVSAMRKVIAERLLYSKQSIPHYYLTIDCEVDNLVSVRKNLNSAQDTKISVNDFIVKAAALALRRVKAVNSAWMDNNTIREYNYVDICVAVATEKGLLTPVVKDADLKGLADISSNVRELAGKARKGTLMPEEYQGGTFTISNLGMMGIKDFTAIINPPQSAILAVGTARKELLPNKGGEDDFGADHRVGTVMSVTLSCDHRTVDGAVGAEWLQHFKRYVENPMEMLL